MRLCRSFILSVWIVYFLAYQLLIYPEIAEWNQEVCQNQNIELNLNNSSPQKKKKKDKTREICIVSSRVWFELTSLTLF